MQAADGVVKGATAAAAWKLQGLLLSGIVLAALCSRVCCVTVTDGFAWPLRLQNHTVVFLQSWQVMRSPHMHSPHVTFAVSTLDVVLQQCTDCESCCFYFQAAFCADVGSARHQQHVPHVLLDSSSCNREA
jgi:hypothetical protein